MSQDRRSRISIGINYVAIPYEIKMLTHSEYLEMFKSTPNYQAIQFIKNDEDHFSDNFFSTNGGNWSVRKIDYNEELQVVKNDSPSQIAPAKRIQQLSKSQTGTMATSQLKKLRKVIKSCLFNKISCQF